MIGRFTERIGFSVSPDVKEAVQAAAEQEGISSSQYLRRLLRQHFQLGQIYTVELTPKEIENLEQAGIEVNG